ncbi:probable G-protein coupled receptor 141 isoform X2 [Pseudorasbora parva]
MAMNTTTAANSTTAANPTVTSSPTPFHLPEPYRIALIVIYTVVLLVGLTGLALMISLLKTNIRSLTTIAFLNLMVAHFLFLLTVPFRIYYYAVQQTWALGSGMCKLVSAMVHIHIYMVFVIYAIILTLRFLHYYKKTQRTEFYRRLHALGASAVVWILLLSIMLPLVLSQYGETNTKTKETTKCFQFGNMIKKNMAVYVVNMILSIFIISVSCLQTCIQAIILHALIRKHGSASRSQQEFWVQVKNLIFVLIMLTCLVPYHLFRLKYLEDTANLHAINEVFLAITGLTCFDMLTFTGKGVCQVCWT